MKNMMQSFTPFLKKFTLLGALIVFFGTVSGATSRSRASTFSLHDVLYLPFRDLLSLTMGDRTWTSSTESEAARLSCPLSLYMALAPKHTMTRVLTDPKRVTGTPTVTVPPGMTEIARRLTTRKEIDGIVFNAGHSKATVSFVPSFLNTLETTSFSLYNIIQCVMMRKAWDKRPGTWDAIPSSMGGDERTAELRKRLATYQTVKTYDEISAQCREALDSFVASPPEEFMNHFGTADWHKAELMKGGTCLEPLASHLTWRKYAQSGLSGRDYRPNLCLFEGEEIKEDHPTDMVSGLRRLLSAYIGFLLIEDVAGYCDNLPSEILASWLARLISSSPASSPADSPRTPPRIGRTATST